MHLHSSDRVSILRLIVIIATVDPIISNCRLIVISIVRLIFLAHFVGQGKEPSYDIIPFMIATQIHSTLSVIVACSPALKPFMDNVRTGMLSASLAKRGPGTTFGQNSYNMQALSNRNSHQPPHTSNTRSERPSISKGPLSLVCAPKGRKKSTEQIYPRARKGQESGNHVYVQSGSGHISELQASSFNGEPLSDLESQPFTNISTSSRRPPPSPEELRPHETKSLAQVETDMVEGLRTGDESAGSGGIIIKKTRRWDVEYEDYHAV
jgi:hypothetical protein